MRLHCVDEENSLSLQTSFPQAVLGTEVCKQPSGHRVFGGRVVAVVFCSPQPHSLGWFFFLI